MSASSLKAISSPSSYETTRYNAIRHGVLCKDVLPWEDATAFQNLKEHFKEDLKPEGAMETYLVEELATLVFRKERLYRAENALITDHLRETGSSYGLDESANLYCDTIDFQKGQRQSFKEVLYPDPQADQESLAYYEWHIDLCEGILQSALTYEEIVKSFPKELAAHWQECLSEEWVDSKGCVYTATTASLKNFLQSNVVDDFRQRKNFMKGRGFIRDQAIGLSYVPTQRMESLQRYKTTLERCFEKKLSMLLQLQDLRKRGLSALTVSSV